jgi:phenylalanyl-tRNA synthetase beta chain
MNILLSHNWLKEQVATKLAPRDLAKQLSLHSMAVEKILPEAPDLSDKVVLAEITEINKHPNADKLKLATVSVGKEKVKVVCGAPNIVVGMKVAFAPLGTMVRWHGEGDPIELKPAKIRGEESFGMICDDSEIGLAKVSNPAGVTDYGYLKAKVGTPMREALKLDDTIFDIEITTNRIDAASVAGMAREVSAMTGAKLVGSGKNLTTQKVKNALPLAVEIKDKEKCLAFHAVVLRNVKVGPSPEWLQRKLRNAGHSTFNNIVDVTNYVMRELGHPLHAFDYEKIADGKLIIRAAKDGEKITTLDGKIENLKSLMAVVADKNAPQAIAGVMGGDAAKITETTTTVLLEAACWDPRTIRRTMKALDKFSDAGGYFNKGISPQAGSAALRRAIALICEITGAEVASKIIDIEPKYKAKQVQLRLERAEQFLGAKLKESTVKTQLEALGFAVKKGKKGVLVCFVPDWRQFDVTIEEDLIEEVARLYGYHNVGNLLPSGRLPTPVFDKQLEVEDALKTVMQGAGYTEVYTYSMVSESLLALSGRQVEQAIRLLNPLDADHVAMRTRVLPSVLEVAAANQGLVGEQHLFEISMAYHPMKKEELPLERAEFVSVILAEDAESSFRQAKGIVETVLRRFGLDKSVVLEASADALYMPKQGMDVKLDGEVVGHFGLVHAKTLSAIGLKKQVAAVELALPALVAKANPVVSYKAIPKFPSVDRDLSITVGADVAWGNVESLVRRVGGALVVSVELFDIYDHGDGKKSFGFHVEYRSNDKTLEMKEVDDVQKNIVEALLKEIGATLRS